MAFGRRFRNVVERKGVLLAPLVLDLRRTLIIRTDIRGTNYQIHSGFLGYIFMDIENPRSQKSASQFMYQSQLLLH